MGARNVGARAHLLTHPRASPCTHTPLATSPTPHSFVYVSTGFGFLFSLTLLAYAVLTLRKSPAYQPGVVGMLALFAAFWFMVLSITITSE